VNSNARKSSKRYYKKMKLCALLLAALLPCIGQTLTADPNKSFGNPAAPVRLDVFSDFECPACRNFHIEMLPKIERDYGPTGRLYIVSHEYPLNIPAHKFSREVAAYATAAARIGKYDAVADSLFQYQQSWYTESKTPGRFWEYIAAVLTPAEQKKVQTLAKDPSVINEVQNDVNLGNRLSVNSTPTIFISHGSQRYTLPWPLDYNLFRSMVDSMK
jgi:protein-disulfide isomerase